MRPVGNAVQEQTAFSLNFSATGRPRVLKVAVTDSAHPSLFDEWVGGSNPDRAEWLDAHREIYPVLWVYVGRVWPVYEYAFNPITAARRHRLPRSPVRVSFCTREEQEETRPRLRSVGHARPLSRLLQTPQRRPLSVGLGRT